MKITTVLFDLDGTLLPMNQDIFVATYFGALAEKLSHHGYDKEELTAVIRKSMKAMMKNTTDEKNESVFWRVFTEAYGKKGKADICVFEEFYEKDFPKVQKAVGFAPEAKKIIDKMGYAI